jgi:hypothetical protein
VIGVGENQFISPHTGLVGRSQNALANSEVLRQVRRATVSRLPFPHLVSDVRDVIYANWVVPYAAIARLVPPGIEIIERHGQVTLTILSYRHGHFGPALSGLLRRLFPSPLQSNWRLYVHSVAGAPVSTPTVLFLKNIFDQTLYTLGTRLMSDSLPSHLAEAFEHHVTTDGYATRIAGGGSAPDFTLALAHSPELVLPDTFRAFFDDEADAIRTLTLQEAAVCAVEDIGRIAHAEIRLPIDPATIVPAIVTDYRPGDWLAALGATVAPFCFVVPQVRFTVLGERLLPA